MNTANITTLANVIENLPPERFNMRSWASSQNGPTPTRHEVVHSCGTVACIGGWAESLAKPDEVMASVAEPGFRLAYNWLGITREQAEELFMPDHKPWGHITQAEAVATLRRLAETGEVKWD